MRVLFITPYVPNALRTRPYYLLKALVARHQLTLLTPTFNSQEEADAARLRTEIPDLEVISVPCSRSQTLANCLIALPRRLPLQARYCYSPALVKIARHLLQANRIELVHIEHFRAAYMGEALADLAIPLVYDAVDSISLLVERTLKHGPLKNRVLSLLELNHTRRYEQKILSAGFFKAVCATSQEDALALEKLAGLEQGTLEVVANGVDINYFSPPALKEQREPNTVVFSGKMSYHANAAAARYLVKEIWPQVRASVPQARLWIVGSRPPSDLMAQSGQHGIEVTGYVPDLGKYLRSASVAVAPMLYSVGIQNKVLEALACATPGVATGEISRAIGVQHRDQLNLVQPGRPGEFARQIIELLQNPPKAAEMGARGRAFVVQQHTWEGAAQRLERIWDTTAKTVLLSEQNTFDLAPSPVK